MSFNKFTRVDYKYLHYPTKIPNFSSGGQFVNFESRIYNGTIKITVTLFMYSRIIIQFLVAYTV